MIVAITEQFHNYKPRFYLVDSDKLNQNNGVDAELLEAIKLPGETAKVVIDGTKYIEAAVSQAAVVESGKSDKSVNLVIKFGDEKPLPNSD